MANNKIKCSLFFFLIIFLLNCNPNLHTLLVENNNPVQNNFYIESAAATSNATVTLLFSENVDQVTAENVVNYAIPGLTVLTATRNATNYSIVDLTTSTHQDLNYTITISNIKDLNNTTISDPDSTVFKGDVVPTVKSVSSVSNTEIVLYFSEDVELITSENIINYTIDTGLTINNATRDLLDFSKVLLTTDSQTDGLMYKITISNVFDLTNNSISIGNNFDYFSGTGVIDNTGPEILFATLIGENIVEVIFSEPVTQISSENMANYTLNDASQNMITISSISRQSTASHVQITTATNLTQAIYSVTVNSNVLDLNSNNLQEYPDNKAFFAGAGTISENFDDGPVLSDPMSEGINNYSMLISYRDRIYIGPASSDNSVFRIKPDGTDPEIISLLFHGESAVTASLNPGPDSEEGIDFIASGTIAGEEYLFIGPSKYSGNLNYIYMTNDYGSVVDFNYLDVGVVLDNSVRGISSMLVFNQRLFFGCPDDISSRPGMGKVQNFIQDPIYNVDIFEMFPELMPRIGASGVPANTASILGIDSMVEYNNRIYLANGGENTTFPAVGKDGGLVRSTVINPSGANSNPDDWEDITPAADNEWNNSPVNDRFSLELFKKNKILPKEKAFPAMVVFNNKLFVIRNTTGGPQLWKHDGTNWTFVANNGSGYTNMGNSNNNRVTLLINNGDRLYVGYDNSVNGVEIYRTQSGITDPSIEADFEQVSTSGLGDAVNNTEIYHGVSAFSGGNAYLWIIVSKKDENVKIYRTKN